MIMKKRFIKTFIAICATTILMISFSACDTNQVAEVKETIKGVDVEKPVHEPILDDWREGMISRGSRPDEAGGPPGEAGGFPGEAGEPPGAAGGEGGFPGGFGGARATPAVYIDNGKYSTGQSKAGVVTAGKVGDDLASDIKINAKEGDIGGVYVKGAGSEYTLSNATIDLSGDGSGLGGAGSGASVDDWATLIIKNSTITTSGENRNATSVQNYGTLKVYNSILTAHGVPFEPDITNTDQKIQLEIDGNSRTHVSLSSYSYFYYCTVIAEGWAALSTDAGDGFVYLEANNCTVKTLKSGYGTYANGWCHNYINNCDFDVASMAAIITGEADVTFRNTNAKCGTYFALIHNIGIPAEVSTLNVTGGEMKTKSPVVLAKSANAEILFDGVKIATDSGILLKSVIAVDPQAAKAADTKGQEVYGIHTTFRDMDVAGDIIHTEDKENRTMTVYLESTRLTGAIKDAYISINPLSKWIATADSNVTIIGNVDFAQIDAPAGVTITAVAGEEGTFTLKSGGTLILKLS